MMDKPRKRDRLKALGKKMSALRPRRSRSQGELFVHTPLPLADQEDKAELVWGGLIAGDLSLSGGQFADPRQRILILTADVGFGHRRAALAVAAALEEAYGDRCAVTVANPLNDARTPAILRNSQVEYDRFVRELPEIYRLQYQITFSPASVAVLEPILTVMLFNVLHDLIHQVRPDVVITTHPHFTAPLAALNTLGAFKGPYLTVITDFTQVHKLWFNDAAEKIFLPTEITRQEALAFGMHAQKLQVTGIPVHPSLLQEQRSKTAIRAEMGWDTQLPLVLVVGSKRVKGLPAVLNVLNHSALPMQLVVVAGGDDRLFARLQQEQWHLPVHLYNFVERMPAFLRAADCIVTKAGGLIASEALACGLPMLLVDVTPGQEEGNAQYVVSHGAAQLATDPIKALETLFHMLEHGGKLLDELAAQALALGWPRSAFEIASSAMAVAESGPLPVPEHRLARIPSLRELLNRGGINLDFLS